MQSEAGKRRGGRSLVHAMRGEGLLFSYIVIQRERVVDQQPRGCAIGCRLVERPCCHCNAIPCVKYVHPSSSEHTRATAVCATTEVQSCTTCATIQEEICDDHEEI